MKVEVITQPNGTVITLIELKNFLKIDLTDTTDNTLLNSLIEVAIENFQDYTGAILRPTGYRVTQHSINSSRIVDLRFLYPISEITLRQYKNENDTNFINSIDFEDILDKYSYVLIKDNIPICRTTNFKIEFIAGFTTIPNLAKHILLMYIAFLYENRGDCNCQDTQGIPKHLQSLMNRYKISVFV